jgi:glycosyltransferase involved in cell wall biosynthesis
MKYRKKVLFVGSFRNETKTGGFGGQMYACNSLINSSLSEEIKWYKIDTTAATNLKVSIVKKLLKAFVRMCKFLYFISFYKFDNVLIFTSNGLSFLEKGTMIILASKLTKANVILAPRSGRLEDEIHSKRKSFIKKVFNHADIVICQGDSWRRLFLKEINNNDHKYVVQKNWIDYTRYSVNENKNNDRVEILFLGWLVEDKGIFDLVKATEYLIEKGITAFRFNVAGRGQDEELFRQTIKDRNVMQYFNLEGWVDGKKKKRLFNENHIFVLPTYFEGMPNALLESMASGIASLASDVGSIPDVINGNNGWMFCRNNANEFLVKLEALVKDKDLQIKLGKNARDYILKEHTVDSAVANFRENIFK